MTEVVSFVHEVDFIQNGHGMRKIILGMFRVIESVLDPCDDCGDEVHAKKRNQHEHGPNSPIVDEDSSEVGPVACYAPEQASSVPLITASRKISVGSNP